MSRGLGLEVIRKLCGLEEEYKRFAMGVGLPVNQVFRRKEFDYFAWPMAVDESFQEVSLESVFKIHDNAFSRSYKKIRSTLSMAAQQLSEMDSDPKEPRLPKVAEDIVRRIIGARMFTQMAMLAATRQAPGPNSVSG